MKLTRRSFLQYTTANALSFFIGDDFWNEPSSSCVVAPTNPLAYFMDHTSVPPLFSDQIFLGYRAIPFQEHAMRLQDDFLVESYGMYVGVRSDGLRSKLELVKTSICGTDAIDQTIVASPLAGAYAAKSEELIKKHQISREKLKDFPYDQRVEEVIKILTNSFRDVLFQDRASEDSVFAKTYPVLRTDNTGLCRDFALTRYAVAKTLGVKDDHLCIVAYLDKDPRMSAHTNIAVYNPGRKVWTVIEGTGRSADQAFGPTVTFENEAQSWEAVKGDYDHLVPVIGITAKGVFLFDSIDHQNSKTYAVFKPRLPLPKIGDKAHVIGNKAEFKP